MKQLLKEDKISDYIKRMIINNSIYDRTQLSTNVNELSQEMKKALHDSAPSIYDACSRNNQNLLAYLRLYFLSYFDISHGKGPLKYAIGLARIAIGELGMFKGQNNDSDLSRLKVCVLFLYNSKDQQLNSQFDGNLNGLNYNELVRQLNDARKEFNKKNRETLSQMMGNASEYTIVPISSYEEASKYGQYTSWCVTHGENHFQSYIQGGRRFYFCLRKGFENVPRQRGAGCPLDEYGLSMISVLVDPEGEPNYITTRWNHENDGENNENMRTAEQLQKITGINFYRTFKPYTLEELRAMGVTPLYAVQDLLDQGVEPYKIFDKIFIEDKNLRRVKLNNKWNFIDKQGKLLFPNQWFDAVYDFTDDFTDDYAVVKLNNKWNFIDKQGKLLSPNQWFDVVEYFTDDYARVKLNNKWNFIDKQGKLLSPNQWFDVAYNFTDDCADVKLNGKWYSVSKNGILAKIYENKIRVTKSDIKKMIMECLDKIIKKNLYLL